MTRCHYIPNEYCYHCHRLKPRDEKISTIIQEPLMPNDWCGTCIDVRSIDS